MQTQHKHVLFLCTGNSARSIIAEGILRQFGGARYRAHSAGSQPTGTPNPAAMAILAEKGIDTSFARSKSWDEFSDKGTDEMALIITVCGNAADEVCPIWPGQPANAHWGVEDPAAIVGTDDEVRAAFAKTYAQMQARITAFLGLSDALDEQSWLKEVRAIGQMPNE